jgi:hypothetical protein
VFLLYFLHFNIHKYFFVIILKNIFHIIKLNKNKNKHNNIFFSLLKCVDNKFYMNKIN